MKFGVRIQREWCQNDDGFWEELIEPMDSANYLSWMNHVSSVLRLEIQPQITHAGKGLKIWTHHAELWWSIRRHKEVKSQQKLRRLSQRLLSFTTPLQLIGSTGPPSSTLPWRYCNCPNQPCIIITPTPTPPHHNHTLVHSCCPAILQHSSRVFFR